MRASSSSYQGKVLIGVDLDAITQESAHLRSLTERPNVQCIGWQGPATNLPFETWYPRMVVKRTQASFNNAADFALAMDMALIAQEIKDRTKGLRIYVVSKDKSVPNIVHWFTEIQSEENTTAHMVYSPEDIVLE